MSTGNFGELSIAPWGTPIYGWFIYVHISWKIQQMDENWGENPDELETSN
jgi:hypothetical protein